MIMYIFLFVTWLISFYQIRKKWMGRQKRCTLRVPIKVIEVISFRPSRGTVLLHKPIFEVCIMGNKVLINSAINTHLFKLEVGQDLWLYINPDNPQDFMYESPYKDKFLFYDKLICVMPFICMLFWFIFYKE